MLCAEYIFAVLVLYLERGVPNNAVVLQNLTLAVSVIRIQAVSTSLSFRSITSFSFGMRNVLRFSSFLHSFVFFYFRLNHLLILYNCSAWNAIFSYKFKQTNYFRINWNSLVNSTRVYCELWFVARCHWQLKRKEYNFQRSTLFRI